MAKKHTGVLARLRNGVRLSKKRTPMDDYAKTAPKSPQAMAAQRAREQQAKLKKVLEAEDELQFKEVLNQEFSVDEGHARYQAIFQIWRHHHPGR